MILKLLHLDNLRRMNQTSPIVPPPTVEVSDLDPMHSLYMLVSMHPFCLNQDL